MPLLLCTMPHLITGVARFAHAAAFIPFRLLRLGLGILYPGQSGSSYSSGLLASPSRMVGICRPSC